MEPQEIYVDYEVPEIPLLYEEVEEQKPKQAHKKEKKYQCSVCSLMCSSPSTLQVHMRTHTGEKPFKCPQCDYAAVAPYVLRAHMKVHIKASERRHLCTICGYRTNYMTSLTVHMRVHTGEKPYLCSECEYRSASRGALQIHMARHTNEKRFWCPHCDYRSTQNYAVKQHIQAKHSSERPYSCHVCSFTTSTRGLLNSHFAIHATEKPFACEQCEFRTHKKQSLDRHMQRHTGIKPFKCDFCEFKTAHKSTIKMHVRLHTDNHPRACDECDEAFTSVHSLRNHVNKFHRNVGKYAYPCFICNNRLPTPKAWMQHLAKHGRQKSALECHLCPFKSVRRSILAAHLANKHQFSKNSWPCPLCGSEFASRQMLMKHAISMHELRNGVGRRAFLKDLKPVMKDRGEDTTNDSKDRPDASNIEPSQETIITIEGVPDNLEDNQILEYVVQQGILDGSVEPNLHFGELPYDTKDPASFNQSNIIDTSATDKVNKATNHENFFKPGNIQQIVVEPEECVIELDEGVEFPNGSIEYIEVASEVVSDDGQVVRL